LVVVSSYCYFGSYIIFGDFKQVNGFFHLFFILLGVVELNPILFGLLIMAFEIAMGLLLLHKGNSVKTGLIGTMVFLIGIAPLSIIQLPWLGLLIGQAYLLTKEFDTTLLAMIKSKFRATAT
jgi:hypothetical protein